MTAKGKVRRWQVMYEIRLVNGGTKRIIQIELLKQGLGNPEGKPIWIDGKRWYTGKFTANEPGNPRVFRFSLDSGFNFDGEKQQGLRIDLMPFMKYVADNRLQGFTRNDKVVAVNAGIEIGAGSPGSQFVNTSYAISVGTKSRPRGTDSPSSDPQEVSSQMAAMREDEALVPAGS
jgi:hypothetical protein